MNIAIRGIEGNIGHHHADSFRQDLHKDLRADFILANPPFNVSDHHLAPNGIAGFVLANGSMSSNQSGEGEIRKKIIEAGLVDCMIALPGQLFYTTPIPVRDPSTSTFRFPSPLRGEGKGEGWLSG